MGTGTAWLGRLWTRCQHRHGRDWLTFGLTIWLTFWQHPNHRHRHQACKQQPQQPVQSRPHHPKPRARRRRTIRNRHRWIVDDSSRRGTHLRPRSRHRSRPRSRPRPSHRRQIKRWIDRSRTHTPKGTTRSRILARRHLFARGRCLHWPRRGSRQDGQNIYRQHRSHGRRLDTTIWGRCSHLMTDARNIRSLALGIEIIV